MEVKRNIIKVLDKGYVELIDWMGQDANIVQAARVSYSYGTAKKVSSDEKLLRFLIQNHHTSPLEMCCMKFRIKMPYFVARQVMRHRTANINEVSSRYSVVKDDYYIPDNSRILTQCPTNKQSSSDDLFCKETADEIIKMIESASESAFEIYNKLLEIQDAENEEIAGLAREIARVILPFNTYTEAIWCMDLNNLLKFLSLRMKPGAQIETVEYANAIASFLKDKFPQTYSAFMDYIYNGVVISHQAIDHIQNNDSDLPLSRTDKETLDHIFGDKTLASP